jgi:hypothetical protein
VMVKNLFSLLMMARDFLRFVFYQGKEVFWNCRKT